LKDFFADFYIDMPELGIASYKMSITTLEDVFHNINKNPNYGYRQDSLLPKQGNMLG